jgi:hypothetical protein
MKAALLRAMAVLRCCTLVRRRTRRRAPVSEGRHSSMRPISATRSARLTSGEIILMQLARSNSRGWDDRRRDLTDLLL